MKGVYRISYGLSYVRSINTKIKEHLVDCKYKRKDKIAVAKLHINTGYSLNFESTILAKVNRCSERIVGEWKNRKIQKFPPKG